MADTQKMLKWTDNTGNILPTAGSTVVSEITGETFDAHSANAEKHLTTAEKSALGNLKPIQFADDIAARDAMAEPFAGLSVYVTDATGDSSVASGGAYYIYNGISWIKTAEAESMDVVNVLSEDELLDLNAKKHEHPNAAALARLGVAGELLTLDNKPVGGIEVVTDAAGTPYAGKIRMLITDYTPPQV